MRARIREKHTEKQLAEIYQKPHQHGHMYDHVVRVNRSIELLREAGEFRSAADLSCGDATILKSLDIEKTYLGDFAPGYEFQGPIEQTIDEIPHVELFVCSETLEHLDDPDLVLGKIREKTDTLFISTPISESLGSSNLEHYWSWAPEDIEQMVTEAGFEVVRYEALIFPQPEYVYDYQLWVVK